jgi:hypothetical protein
MGRVLFIGLGRSAVCHYRCRLPAEALGHDWIGVSHDFAVETGGKAHGIPDIDSYDTVVCQQAHGVKWERRIDKLHEKDVRVLYDTDDYLHGIRHLIDHGSSQHFTPGLMKKYDRCMAMCDELIVSTPFLAERYRSINPHVTVCRNGIDPDRYDYVKPTRDYITVGWAGGTGHYSAVRSWLEGGILDALEDHPTSQFLAIGQPEVAQLAVERLGDDRALGVPFGPFRTYSTAMAGIDIFLAPAGQDKWYRGKSDLRWLEASALGQPCICAPRLYPEAEYVASSPDDAARILRDLLSDPASIAAAGQRARETVLSHRSFPDAVAPWRTLLS